MKFRPIFSFVGVALALRVGLAAAPQVPQEPTPSFKSGVDLVRISAVVRDRKGHFVQDLSARDFEVVDSGARPAILDLRGEQTALSVALLIDASGSMANNFADAREAAMHLLAWLDPARDEVAVYTFDTALIQVEPFTQGLRVLPDTVARVKPYGATSLHDAIARTAQQMDNREGRRRAVIVFTDGDDTASRLTAPEVSAIASSIDVPVYIFGIVASIDDPSADVFASTDSRSPLTGSLSDLSDWTGGRTVVASTLVGRSVAARQVVEELRHQYVLTFESNGVTGWHPLVIRARGKDLTVRARSGYFAGQSRPNSAFGVTQNTSELPKAF